MTGRVLVLALLVGSSGRARGDELVDYSWFHRMMRPDQAPPLNRPTALEGRSAPLRPRDLVVGLDVGTTARAYPLGVLAYHRVINDRLAGRRVAVAHAPLTGATLCAETAGDLFFSGAVYEADDLLGDTEAGDLWSVLRGRSVLGPRLGRPLKRLVCHVMTWAAWRAQRPATTVAWSHAPPRGFDYRRDPWAWYRADDPHMVAPVHFLDLRLPRKRAVVGVSHGGRAVAFPLPARGGVRLIHADVAGQSVLVVLDGSAGFGAAYLRGDASFVLARDGRHLIDRQTGSRWNLLGEAVAGPRARQRLAPASATRAFFFAWAALYPGTEIHLRRTDDE